MGGLFGTPRGLKQASGSVSWLQNIGNTIGNYVNPAGALGFPELDSFAKWLDQLTSSDPTARMTAAGPQIADITAQTESQKQSIKNLPRGGEQAFLTANADQAKSSAIGNLLTKEFSDAQMAKSDLGKFGVETVLKGLGEAANVEQGAGQLATGLIGPEAAGSAATMQSIMDIIQMAAPAATAGG